MIYEYDELKEYIQEDFDRFYKFEFNEKQILPATLDVYRYSKHFTQVEIICIHIFLICLYMQNAMKPKIVVKELKKLMHTQDQQAIKAELGDDYEKFLKDYNTLINKGIRLMSIN